MSPDDDDDELDDDNETLDEALKEVFPDDPGQAREILQDFSKRLGRPVGTLYVMDAWTDPFYIGEVRKAGAEWFAQIWRDLGIPLGYHYRRIHYKMISQDPPLAFWKGGNYQNTEMHWYELNIAARDAVALGFIPLDAFVDRRNPNPIIYLQQPIDTQIGPIEDGAATIPSARFWAPALAALWRADPGIIPQRYHIEIWAEKSTMNDILDPLARHYGVNLITGVGELISHGLPELHQSSQIRPTGAHHLHHGF